MSHLNKGKKTNHMGQKAGPWSAQEKQFIEDQAGKLLPEDIAKSLRRNPTKVADYMLKNGLMNYYAKSMLEKDPLENLQKSRHWNDLKKQYNQEELELFEYHWKNFVKQFRDDITHTEEIQIIDAIKLELKMHQSQIRQKQSTDMIDKIRKQIDKLEKEKPSDDVEANRKERKLERLQRDLCNLYSGFEADEKNYIVLQKQKNEALRLLKSTRDQRISQIESSKETLIGWVKSLYTNPKLRHDLGIRMEKMRLATQAEYKRLSEYFVYADGMVDKPIFNCDTVWDSKDQKTTEDINETEQIQDTKKQEENVVNETTIPANSVSKEN